jgi:predicted TIM-barrel fold metal-dependent hydrolase
MSTVQPAVEAVSATGTIDACVYHDWASTAALAPYLDPGWRELALREGDRGGPMTLRSEFLYVHPQGFADDHTYPEEQAAATGQVNPLTGQRTGGRGGAAGSEVQLTLRQAVDGHAHAILGYHEGLLSTGLNNYLLARAVVRAANRWTIDEWLSEDDRLRALVMICSADPSAAATDIREFGAHPRMVGVALGANCLGRPFGHAAYHEIYAAAADVGLPIVIQSDGDAVAALLGMPTSGGRPATYAEYATNSSQALAGHVWSFVVDGVFAKFPTLRILCVGGGAAWLPPTAWRVDYWYNANAHETPWLDRLPSSFLAGHVRIGTSSLERPRNEGELAALWNAWPAFSRMLVYTSGYPSREAESVSAVAARIPREWHQSVFSDNAAELFSLPHG